LSGTGVSLATSTGGGTAAHTEGLGETDFEERFHFTLLFKVKWKRGSDTHVSGSNTGQQLMQACLATVKKKK
jgi:hypothetical protein